MATKPTLVSRAFLSITLERYDSGICQGFIQAELPGVDQFKRTFTCDVRESDEAFAWGEDLHNESKSWRSLMDCVAYDWANSSLSLFS